MAPPTQYSTEKELATYMAAILGPLGATTLGLAVGVADAGSYAEAVNDVLLEGGWAAITDATNIPRVRAYARYYAWKLAQAQAAALFSFSADGGRYDLKDLQENIGKNLALCFTDAAVYGLSDYSIVVTQVKDLTDPYNNVPFDERTV